MKTKRRSQNVRMRGALKIAAKLNVTRVTVWRVVNGKTHSPHLLEKIRSLISEQNAIQPTPNL